MAVRSGGKRTRGFSEHRESCPSVQKKIDWLPPQLSIPGVPQVLLGWGLWSEPPDTFSPDCLESLTPGIYCLRGQSLLRCRAGWLRCLRPIPLEMPLLSTVITNPSLFTWVSLGIFLRLFQWRSNSHCWGFSLSPGSFLLLFLFLIFATIIYYMSQLQQFFF